MNLKNSGQIQGLDKGRMLPSIEALPEQCQQAWEEGQEVAVPSSYRRVKNIVVAGMGGSALGAHLIQSLYTGKELRIPLSIVNDYNLPTYVNEESLVILSSYSGGTEETLNCAREALEKKAKILGITTGGKLSEFLKANNLPGYIFAPKYNFCGQPRIGLGYSFLGQLALLKKTGILNLNETEISLLIKKLIISKEKIIKEAERIALALENKIPVIVAAEFLAGNTHVLANQFNENAKTMSFYFILPEMNHHLLEGLRNPNLANFAFLFFSSPLYPTGIKKRLELTKEVVAKNGIKVLEFQPAGKEPLLEVLETLWFGSFSSFHLAVDYKIDPSPIPWVDYFKKNLTAHEER